VDNVLPLEDCISIRAANEDLTPPCVLATFLSSEVACDRTATDDVLKEVSVAFSFAGARLPTLALGRLAKSFAGWCLDIFLLVGAMMRFQLGMGD
jgi:hypothetical protein